MRLSSCEAVYLIDHLPMRSNYVQIPANSYFIGRGGVGGVGGVEESTLRLNSAQFQLKLPAGAELGNTVLF